MPAFPQSGPVLDAQIQLLMSTQPQAFTSYDSTKNQLLSQAMYATAGRTSGYTIAGLFCQGEWQGFNGEYAPGGVCPETVTPPATVTYPSSPAPIVSQPSAPLPIISPLRDAQGYSGAATPTPRPSSTGSAVGPVTAPRISPPPPMLVQTSKGPAPFPPGGMGPVMQPIPFSQVLPKNGGRQIIDVPYALSPIEAMPGDIQSGDSPAYPAGEVPGMDFFPGDMGPVIGPGMPGGSDVSTGGGYYTPRPGSRSTESSSFIVAMESLPWPLILLGVGAIIIFSNRK